MPIINPMIAAEIPSRAGVGLKAEHYEDILSVKPDIGWFEVHAENYMGDGGAPHHYLTRIRREWPLSLHGVGLSIGASQPLDQDHLLRLKKLVDRYEPGLFSEHLAWSTHEDIYLTDLLPVPYNRETLQTVCNHIDEVQTVLGRQMLLENPSTYIAFQTSTMSEVEFLSEVSKRTGCGLLLDVNNVFVSAANHDMSAHAYLDAFPLESVGEIHLGGHAPDSDDEGCLLLIDAHDRAVADPVWALYDRTIRSAGALPTLVEWDTDIPDWQTLFNEALAAEAILLGEKSADRRGAIAV